MRARALIRDVKSNFGARLKTLNMQSIAVKQLDPVVHVQQTDFIPRHLVRLHALNDFWINPVAGIAHGNPHPVAAFGNADGDDAFAFTGLNTVNNCVFDQRLDKQAWDHAVDLFINIVNDRELVAKAGLLDRDVVLDLIKLFFDVDLLVIFQFDVVAQIARQVKNQLARGVRI